METQQRRLRRLGRSRSLGSASSSIRTAIGAIVKRFNGNYSRMTRTIEGIKMHRLFQDSMLFLHCVPEKGFQNGTTNTREWRRSSSTSVWYILHYAYSLLKENNSAINRLPLGLYALFYRTPAKIMLPPHVQTVQYRFLRRTRRLYGNQKSPLSCRSSGSLQNIFETIGIVRVMQEWFPFNRLQNFRDRPDRPERT